MKQKKHIKESTWISRMSKGERYFWLTIAILMLCHISLHYFAAKNSPGREVIGNEPSNKTQPVLYELIVSEKAKYNLKLAAPLLVESMQKELKEINLQVDRVFDLIFLEIENNNVDKFLDFHYSVIGEYTELGAMATGKIGKTIQEKLLGTDFSQKISHAASQTDNQYFQAIKRHSSLLEEHAYQNVDMSLNAEAIASLNNEIQKNISQQGGKIGILLSARLAPKVIAAISAKLAAKATGKIALKTGAKLTAKSANALMGASAGSLCGPAIIICSPVFAVGAWFARDAVITTGDEILNRKQFKAEIISLLKEQKNSLKSEYKKQYSQSFERFSEVVKQQMGELETRERVRIKDQIFKTK